MKAGIKLAMLGCSGDPKSYHVSDIPGTSSFPTHELLSSLAFLSAMNFCKSEKLLHLKSIFSSFLLCTLLATGKIIPCSLHTVFHLQLRTFNWNLRGCDQLEENIQKIKHWDYFWDSVFKYTTPGFNYLKTKLWQHCNWNFTTSCKRSLSSAPKKEVRRVTGELASR